ncbi:DUF938 domain-containing protein [Arenibaculum pallidiluteum]|uniref:DUF938 domain-containing protein n=1 Tax=Arenibaculum pallidiluteum TaxID=2812559 RepID=UPI001A9618CF|nr:DUF938 domain-containing protein [Arenibaculum pallidiluteum]
MAGQDERSPAPDARRHAPATERNRDPILSVLRQVLPASGLVLEVASGTGQHAAFLAAALPGLVWQPSDRDPELRASIAAWSAGLPNLLAPLEIDATRRPWPVARADAVFCANMIHIAPWDAALGLVAGAAELLPGGAPLVLYGPFRRGGAHTAPSNAAFDEDLRARDPAWGVRDLERVAEAAAAVGFTAPEIHPMPANNLTVVFRRG